jgi:hypothetical protein
MDDREKLVQIDTYRRKKRLISLAADWENSLPAPSQAYPHLIFLYSEELATKNRQLLFRKIDLAAETNDQTLVISDCHYSRAGFYILYDEIGGGDPNPVDIDAIIDSWSEQDKS